MALGAGKEQVLKLIVGQGMLPVGIGVAVGLGIAFGVTRLLSSLLYGVKPSDPLTFGGVAVVLTVVALFAIYIPARRAMKVDPVVALRNE
jgi:ABC-type antimicrobial peptide transport system permease subunit